MYQTVEAQQAAPVKLNNSVKLNSAVQFKCTALMLNRIEAKLRLSQNC